MRRSCGSRTRPSSSRHSGAQRADAARRPHGTLLGTPLPTRPLQLGGRGGSGCSAHFACRSARPSSQLLAPNSAASIDVFAHSWEPHLASLIGELYAPKWSLHEKVHRRLNKVQSAALSLATALAAKRAHETTRGSRYDLVAVLRYDLLWYSPLDFAKLPRGQLWVAGQCCNFDPYSYGGLPSEIKRAYAQASAACFGKGASLSDYCRVSYFMRSAGDLAARPAREAEYNYFVNDWFLLAPSETADSLLRINSSYEGYSEALAEVGIGLRWMHFFWSMHFHHALGLTAGVRAPLLVGTDFGLLRHFGHSATGQRCRSNVSVAALLPKPQAPVWQAARRFCPARGQVTCEMSSLRCAVRNDA